MKGLGIHIRLLLAAVILISAATFTLGYMGINITREFVNSRFEERILFLARYLALNSELGILIGQKAMLERLAGNLLAEKDVVTVTIIGENDEILANASKNVSGDISIVEVPVIIQKTKGFPWGMVSEKDKNIIGKVKITYSTEGIKKLMKTMSIRFLWLSLGLAGLCVFIFYFISRSLVAPVSRLAAAARQVAEGDMKIRVEPGNLPETRELALAFNAMLDSLETSQAALKRANKEMITQNTLARMGKFSLMIAHEVKNPLAIIKSSLDILKKKIEKASENTMILYIEDEISRLNKLIEDFLLFAKPAVPNFRQVDLNNMLKGQILRFEVQLNGSSLDIQTSIPQYPCYTEADPDLMMRAIGNILKNAAEANDYNGYIDVNVFCENKHWILNIGDQGTGIDGKNIEKIFDPFFTTRSKGTGLGLAFVSQVIKSHQGKVWAENRKGEPGALFCIKLPLRTEIT
ncbi:Two component system histidine kinase, HAMP domain-containing [Desulfonema limicola]|uniref:histidine kinase n=1 Tax=Desulfonema limicola TaxID=45656 RepID=A0A975GGQ6_9BACT|nr:HAMP domain-containing sensor histidine kinase [Desulfonema limicola]QTA80610.1 Two component system histidine kinase, HAMP domain-containing [Desulfonema limicola]